MRGAREEGSSSPPFALDEEKLIGFSFGPERGDKSFLPRAKNALLPSTCTLSVERKDVKISPIPPPKGGGVQTSHHFGRFPPPCRRRVPYA